MPKYVLGGLKRDLLNIVSSGVNLGDRRLDDAYMKDDFEPMAPPSENMIPVPDTKQDCEYEYPTLRR